MKHHNTQKLAPPTEYTTKGKPESKDTSSSIASDKNSPKSDYSTSSGHNEGKDKDVSNSNESMDEDQMDNEETQHNTELMDVVDSKDRQIKSPEPIMIEITSYTPEWCGEDSDGEAACSRDEKSPPKWNLQGIIPTPSVATTSSNIAFSSLSNNTDPSLMIDPSSGQHLISVEIQLQPEKEHLQVMFSETKCLLDYVQELDPSA